MKETWLILEGNTRSFSYGSIIDDELHFYDIGIVDSIHNWGLTVICPFGNVTYKTANHDKVINIDIIDDDKTLSITAYRRERHYEISIVE